MNIIITLFAVVVLVTGVYYNRAEKFPLEEIGRNEVLSETHSNDQENEHNDLYEDVISPANTSVISKAITPTPIATTVITANDFDFDLKRFIYPNTSIESQNSNELILASFDDVDKITTWYKDVISLSEMNVTSFVTTNTNDNVLNKLVGAGNNSKASILITKSSGDDRVIIEISSE